MKRAMAGKGRKGSPPLPRQRRALRVVQLSLLILAGTLVRAAWLGWLDHSRAGGDPVLGPPRAGVALIAVLSVAAASAFGTALWMGIRIVKGPEPPTL
ncbi:MAG: hypothetical protein ABR507_12570 [Actinomycetota bacterium]|nr:hypothetical protein [Actinomycetota bacterium]